MFAVKVNFSGVFNVKFIIAEEELLNKDNTAPTYLQLTSRVKVKLMKVELGFMG